MAVRVTVIVTLTDVVQRQKCGLECVKGKVEVAVAVTVTVTLHIIITINIFFGLQILSK